MKNYICPMSKSKNTMFQGITHCDSCAHSYPHKHTELCSPKLIKSSIKDFYYNYLGPGKILNIKCPNYNNQYLDQEFLKEKLTCIEITDKRKSK
jgi:hypothetical protein